MTPGTIVFLAFAAITIYGMRSRSSDVVLFFGIATLLVGCNIAGI